MVKIGTLFLAQGRRLLIWAGNVVFYVIAWAAFLVAVVVDEIASAAE